MALACRGLRGQFCPPHCALPSSPLPQASSYLKQGKYREAEELYKEILTCHDQDLVPMQDGEPGGQDGTTLLSSRLGLQAPPRDLTHSRPHR